MKDFWIKGLFSLGLTLLIVGLVLTPTGRLWADDDGGGSTGTVPGPCWTCNDCSGATPPVPLVPGAFCTGITAVCGSSFTCLSCACTYSVFFGCGCR